MSGIGKKTQGEIEAAACEALDGFAREFLGRTPRSARAYLRNDLLMVRLQGGLSLTEVRLLATRGRGRDLVKEMHADLVEMARPILGQLVEGITGAKIRSLHHDISTVTGEEIIVFTFVEAPLLLSKAIRR